MRVAIVSTDNREEHKHYTVDRPIIPTSQEALLQGMMHGKDVEIHLVSCFQEDVVSPAKLADNIFFHSLKVPKLGWMRTGFQGCIRAVRRKLAEIQPDIVHGQGSERECAISVVWSGFPNVITIHGIMQEQARLLGSRPWNYHWLAARLESYALRRTDGVFCNSAYTESCLRPRSRRTWRVANPLRAALYDTPRTGFPPSARPVFLNIGVVSRRKRQNELIESLARLRSSGCDFEINFVGHIDPGEAYGRRFLELVRTHSAWVRHLGKKDTLGLIETCDRSSALLHVPSEESFGLVVGEALTRNLKLFAFNVGGIPDVAAGVDGVELIRDADWEALNQRLREWIGQGCPQPVNAVTAMRRLFHPQVIAEQHLAIYREVLGRPA